ncbi:MAG: hypothetical protein ACRD7E_22295 [Bryobacteraceae bacterium]
MSKVMNAGRLAAAADANQLSSVQESLANLWVEAQQLFGMPGMTWMAMVKVKGSVEKLPLSDPASGI